MPPMPHRTLPSPRLSSLPCLVFILLAALCLTNTARAEVRLVCPSSVPEGEPFFARVEADEPVDRVVFTWLGKEVAVLPDRIEDGYQAQVLLGMGMKEKLKGDSHVLAVRVDRPQGGADLTQTVSRTDKAYPEQHLEVAKSYTSLSQENLDRHEREKKEVARAKATLTPVRLYEFPFVRPVPGEVSSDFGLRRFFNGEARSPHSGVDLRADQGDPVHACASGVVVLAADHFFAGNSVYVDHGQGVVSMYFHMSRILVKNGDRVEQGQILGEIGSTGRVTGPHLHWGVSVLGQLIDPLLLTGP